MFINSKTYASRLTFQFAYLFSFFFDSYVQAAAAAAARNDNKRLAEEEEKKMEIEKSKPNANPSTIQEIAKKAQVMFV